jgi:hypothetical protein
MRHAEFQPLSGRHVLFARRSSRQALAQRYVRRGQRCRQRRTRRSIVLAAWDRLAHSQKAIQPEGRLRPLPDGEIVFGGEVSWCAPRCLEDRNSVCLDARELHHLAPLLDLVTNELSEVSGGAPSAVMPMSEKRAMTFGSARRVLISRLSFSIMLAGVFLGAPTPVYPLFS